MKHATDRPAGPDALEKEPHKSRVRSAPEAEQPGCSKAAGLQEHRGDDRMNAVTTSVCKPVRIGAVSYLNSKPLIEGLPELTADARVLLDYPSRLADDLAGGLLDVALIPSIEYFDDPDYRILSDACVAARGSVLSVKLYCRVPPGSIATLALDEGSRTSAALARILLAERFGVFPEIEPLPLGHSADSTSADAILLIGDRAMHPLQERFEAIWDLGEEWFGWTGLPFVFAMWVARDGSDLGDVEQALNRARDRGVERINDIAAREAPLLGISEEVAADYLTNNLHYRLGSAERNGLALFHKLAAKIGLVSQFDDLDV